MHLQIPSDALEDLVCLRVGGDRLSAAMQVDRLVVHFPATDRWRGKNCPLNEPQGEGQRGQEDGEREAVTERFRSMQFEIEGLGYPSYMEAFQENGGVVEEFLSGEEVHSPSVQLRNSPLGEVEILSTHDQLLGGPSGQTFLGAVFPARQAYLALITRDAQKIGERLAREGVIGRYAVDFLVIRKPGGAWHSYAIEINLRKGGTTTPYLTLQYLTRGQYDPESGLFQTLRGQEKYYVASDHIESEAYRQYTPLDLFDLLSANRLHFDHAGQTGIVLHMMSGVGTYGSVGVTAIDNSPAEAQALYQTFQDVLDRGT